MKQVGWKSPSNIALVKYWGKRAVQLPQNASLSFTLQNAFTTMEIGFEEAEALEVDFYFEQHENKKFKDKIEQFLQFLLSETFTRAYPAYDFSFLARRSLTIHSSNSFPHSAGIASSASSMSALALCLCSMAEMERKPLAPDDFRRKASVIARLASGSACRSIEGQATVWGTTPALADSSDEYAVPLSFPLSPVFQNFRDTILIVSAAEKSVSSRAGHKLMDTHPFAQVRYQQAQRHLDELIPALQQGDTAAFIRIVENEALTLHGLMLNSEPSFVLLKPATLALIDKIRQYRADTKQPVCFTLDAGPNVHLLYPDALSAEVEAWIAAELAPYCEQSYYLHDRIGNGAVPIAHPNH